MKYAKQVGFLLLGLFLIYPQSLMASSEAENDRFVSEVKFQWEYLQTSNMTTENKYRSVQQLAKRVFVRSMNYPDDLRLKYWSAVTLDSLAILKPGIGGMSLAIQARYLFDALSREVEGLANID